MRHFSKGQTKKKKTYQIFDPFFLSVFVYSLIMEGTYIKVLDNGVFFFLHHPLSSHGSQAIFFTPWIKLFEKGERVYSV